VALAVDCAASQFAGGDGRYSLRREGRELDRAAWLDELTQWCHRYPIVSLEDGLAEDDWEGLRDATARLAHSTQLVGDDLFATNSNRLQPRNRRRHR
jgi:enolase